MSGTSISALHDQHFSPFFFKKVAQEYSVEVIKKQARASGQIATRVNDPKTGKVRVLVGC